MKQSDRGWIRSLGDISSIGMLILISTAIGLGIGVWLDRKLGTTPWLAFVLTVVGLAAGLYESIRMLIRVTRDGDDG